MSVIGFIKKKKEAIVSNVRSSIPIALVEKRNRLFRWATVSQNKDQLDTFIFPSTSDPPMPGVVQSLTALTIENPYFEVVILDGGAVRGISMGLAHASYPLDSPPGESERSCGYLAQDGFMWSNGPRGMCGSVCHTGDTMGCGAEVENGVFTGHIYFTREGRLVNWLSIPLATDCLLPTISLTSRGEAVRINLRANRPSALGSNLSAAVPERLAACEGLRQAATRSATTGAPRFTYVGGGADIEVAQIRGQSALRPPYSVAARAVTYSYFEVRLVSVSADRRVSIGVAADGNNYPFGAHPGQRKTPASAGYMADGGLYESELRTTHTWPQCDPGDVMGCGVEHVTSAAATSGASGEETSRIFFTRNGNVVGYASAKLPSRELYAIVGLRTKGDEVEVNMDARWPQAGGEESPSARAMRTSATSSPAAVTAAVEGSASPGTGAGAGAKAGGLSVVTTTSSPTTTPAVSAAAASVDGSPAIKVTPETPRRGPAASTPVLPTTPSGGSSVIYASTIHGEDGPIYATPPPGMNSAGAISGSNSATPTNSRPTSLAPSVTNSMDISSMGAPTPSASVEISSNDANGRPRDVRKWSVGDVGGWLVSLSLEPLVAQFAENHINGVVLLELTEEEVKNDLKVSLGHRKLLLKALKDLSDATPKQSMGKSASESTLGRFSVDMSASAGGLESLSVDIVASEVNLGEVIGRGSFGVVYKARWRGADVAVKRVLVQHLTPTGLTDLRREATIMKRLPPHPNVVMFLGAYAEPSHYCLVTQFCEGGSLHALLHSDAMLGVPEKVRLAEGAAAGMLHLSREGLVHRDLAARNVLVTQRPQLTAVIIDFGLSREDLVSSNQTESTLGPIKWMSPESLTNREYSSKSDVWSFGVLLYEIFEQKEPWAELSNIDVAVAVTKESKRMKLTAVMPDTVGELIRACWAQAPTDRPAFEQVFASLVDTRERMSAGAHYSAVL